MSKTVVVVIDGQQQPPVTMNWGDTLTIGFTEEMQHIVGNTAPLRKTIELMSVAPSVKAARKIAQQRAHLH